LEKIILQAIQRAWRATGLSLETSATIYVVRKKHLKANCVVAHYIQKLLI